MIEDSGNEDPRLWQGGEIENPVAKLPGTKADIVRRPYVRITRVGNARSLDWGTTSPRPGSNSPPERATKDLGETGLEL